MLTFDTALIVLAGIALFAARALILQFRRNSSAVALTM